MKILKEKDLVPGLVCEFEASGKTSKQIQKKYANHFDTFHQKQRGQLTKKQINAIDEKAFEILSLQN